MSIPVLQTVAAINYLPFVLVLAQSIEEHLPGARLSVLLTDASPALVERVRERFGGRMDFLGCDSLEIKHLSTMRQYYSVLEFNSACKVLALDFQIRTRCNDACLFVDPDMFALGNFVDPALALAGDIVLTPHTLAPYPEDNELPNEMELAISGQINGGYVLVRNSEAASRAMTWLVDQTRYNWFVAPSHGLFADQQWLSLLPMFFPGIAVLLRDAGVNIAYWNLHERKLRAPAGAGTSKGGMRAPEDAIVVESIATYRAKLFHFSGFTQAGGGRLSKHSGRRFDPETERILARLIDRYQSALKRQRENVQKAGIASDIEFSRRPLLARMKAAQARWGIRHVELAPPPGRFGRIGSSLDQWLS